MNMTTMDSFLYKPDEKVLEELSPYFRRLITVFDEHMRMVEAGELPDDKLNVIYLQLCDRIDELIHSTGIPAINEKHYKRPYSALPTSQRKAASAGKIREELVELYGEIQLALYRCLPPKSRIPDLAAIDAYMDERKAQSEPNREPPNPIPIKLVDGSQVKVTGSASGDKGGPRFPYTLPDGTDWPQVYIVFLDSENVLIKSLQYELETDYKGMGFTGKDSNSPSVLWSFLVVLAKSTNNEITIQDPDAKAEYKKQKQLVSKKLKSYFRIHISPFHRYESSMQGKKRNSYKPRFNIFFSDKSEAKHEGGTKVAVGKQ